MICTQDDQADLAIIYVPSVCPWSRLLEFCPVPYSLYLKCVEVEEMGVVSGEGNMDKLREVYERAIRDYGSSRVGKSGVHERGINAMVV